MKLVPNLVYSSKLLMRKQLDASANSSSSGDFGSDLASKMVDELTDEDLQALEYIYLLICHLVHSEDGFLTQFCDAVVVLNFHKFLCRFLTLST